MPLEITYWATANGTSSRACPGDIVSSEQRTISGTSAQSGATPAGSIFMSIYATENARFNYVPDTTVATAAAGANGSYIGAGERLWLPAKSGYKVGAITPA